MLYEELKALIAGDKEAAFKILTSQKKDYDLATLKDQWDIAKHKVMSTAHRANKQVKVATGAVDNNQRPIMKNGTIQVARIPLPYQKKIVSKAVSFLFGNPVTLVVEGEDTAQAEVLKTLNYVLDDNKTDGLNMEMAEELFRATEVAEYWYTRQGREPHELYGFPTNFKLRVQILKPWTGVLLYPFFDDGGDLIAFSREYVTIGPDGKDLTRFSVCTEDYFYEWAKGEQSGWVDHLPASINPIKKIPIVYGSQDEAEYADVTFCIDRLETLISNHADTNDYNGSPIAVSSGKVISMVQKGESGKLLEVEKGGDVKYLSWDHAPESIKLEIENLIKDIHSFTQTPNIDFESVKNISQISGVALRLLFMDAHLKVAEKRRIMDPYMARRMSIMKAYMSLIDKNRAESYKKTRVKVRINPYQIRDAETEAKVIQIATGSKAVMSRKTGISQLGAVDDAQSEMLQIEAEEAEANLKTNELDFR